MSQNPLLLLSSMAAREVLRELAAQYSRLSGQAVHAAAAGGVDVAKRVAGGEQVDVVVLSDTAIDKLIGAGQLLPDSRIDIARSGVAVAVRAGTTAPDVSGEQAVKQAVLNAATLSYSTGPSGIYLEKLFERWGILAAVRDRIVVPPPGTPVASLVADGRAELGFQQLSELLNVPGIQVLGALPAAIQCITVFSGGVGANSDRPDDARALLAYMASPPAEEVKHRYGMEAA